MTVETATKKAKSFNMRYSFGRAVKIREKIEAFRKQSFLPWEITFTNLPYDRKQTFDPLFILKHDRIEISLSVAIEDNYGWARESWDIRVGGSIRERKNKYEDTVDFIEEYLPLDAMETIVEVDSLKNFIKSINHEMFWWYTVAARDTHQYVPFQEKHVEIYRSNTLAVAAVTSAEDFVKLLDKDEKRAARFHCMSWGSVSPFRFYFGVIIAANLASAFSTMKWQNFLLSFIIILGATVGIYLESKSRFKKKPDVEDDMKRELRQALKQDRLKKRKQPILVPDIVQS